jgi:hypothetical protein
MTYTEWPIVVALVNRLCLDLGVALQSDRLSNEKRAGFPTGPVLLGV